jgi:hypothetical protein
MIEYIVEWAKYEPILCECDHCNASGADFDMSYSFHESKVSDVIDERTIRSRVFKNEDEAYQLASDLSNKNDKWLAYLRIKKIKSEIIEEFKGMASKLI